MINKAFLFNESGFAEPIDLSAIAKQKNIVWVQLSHSSAKSIIEKVLSAPSAVAHFLLADETRPRTTFDDDALLATYRGVNFNKGQDPEDMVAIRLWMTKNIIVTVQHRNLISVNNIQDALVVGSGPKNSGEFLVRLLHELTQKSSDISFELTEELDSIEELDVSVQQLKINYELLSNLRRRILLLQRYLAPQYEAIQGFEASELSWLTLDQYSALTEIANLNRLVLENLHTERDRAKIIQEEFSTLDQQLLNRKMYLLAIVTVIFMPLSFLTGLLGVNLGGIPGATTHYAFSLLILALIMLGIMQVIQLKRRGWL